MKTKISTKEIRTSIEIGILQSITMMDGFEPSRKVQSAIKKASRDIALKVKIEMKKKIKKAEKAIKVAEKDAKKKKGEAKEKPVESK